MSFDKNEGHKYTFSGFKGPYWEAKAAKEAAEEEAKAAKSKAKK